MNEGRRGPWRGVRTRIPNPAPRRIHQFMIHDLTPSRPKAHHYNSSMNTLLALMLTLAAAASPAGAQRGGAKPAAAPPAPFVTTLTMQEMTAKQAVVNTTAGTFVIDLRPDLAPNHVGYFIKLAREGAYDGTIFHRVIRLGIIQGGDPLSKDPAKAKLYGTGGLGVLKAEISERARDARRGGRGDAAESSRQRGRAVLRLRHRPAARSTASTRSSDASARAWTSCRRSPRRPSDAEGMPDRADRDRVDHDSRHAAAGAGAVLDRDGRRTGAVSRRARDHRGPDHRSSSSRTRRPSTCATSCVSRRRASSTAPRSTASSRASSSRPDRSTAAGR